MATKINSNRHSLLLALIALLLSTPALASHIAGDEFTYKYTGDTVIGGQLRHKYEVTLNLYADCLGGEPMAIEQDNPAFFAVYKGDNLYANDSLINYSYTGYLPALSSSPCGTGGTASICILKRTFVKIFYLPPSDTAYTIAYQRCCRNAAVTNIMAPGSAGVSYFCTIPPSALAGINTSAVFSSYPPLLVYNSLPFSVDVSATDADGDSLSYELSDTYSADITVLLTSRPLPPPYTSTTYISPLSYSNPMYCSAPVAIDPVTGMLTGTPSALGRDVVSVACKEWRGGTLINTTRREFELSVVSFTGTDYHPAAGTDTTIFVGDSLNFAASGAVNYDWTPGTYLSSAIIPNPTGHFTIAGVFPYILHGISDSGCSGYDTLIVTVLEHAEMRLPTAFTPNNDGINDYFAPIPVKNATLTSMRIFNQYGQRIYNNENGVKGWDGKFKGETQKLGVYYYEILYSDEKAATHNQSGTVTLIR